MKEINVNSHSVPATARSKNYRTAQATTTSSGGGGGGGGGATSPSVVTPTGGAADTAKVAQNLAADSTDWSKILRKDIDERTENSLSIGKDITVDGKARFTSATITGALLASTVNATTINATTFIGELQGNAATATQLKTTHKIFGNDFNGLSDVNGTVYANTGLRSRNICVETDSDGSGGGRSSEINNFNSSLFLQLATPNNLSCCYGGGNVGIGTTNAQYKLDVNGNARIASDLYADATVGTINFASRMSGWQVNAQGAADFRNIYADELRVQAFTADISQALAGSDYLTKSVSKLSANFIVPAVNSTVRIIVDDIEGTPATQCFANNDYIRFRAFNRTSGLTIANVWGTVVLDTTYGTNGFLNGTQAYTFTCKATSGAGLTVFKGSEVLDYGTTGSGMISRTTLDAMGSPYEQIATWINDPSVSTNYTVHARLGNLNGIANCNGYGLYTDNGFFTGKITVGDLTKNNNYLDFSGGALTVKGNVYLASGDSAVGSNGVISAINLTSEAATIQASKINLNGAVTIGALDSSVTAAALGGATPSDVSTAVNNIQIGGRNLLIGTTNLGVISIISTNPSTVISGGASFANLVKGATYWVSFDAQYISGDGKLHCELWGSQGGDIIVSNTSYKRYGLKSTWGILGSPNLFFWLANETGQINIKNIKIEIGTNTTYSDYSPAPEDVDANIATAQNTANTALSNAASAQTDVTNKVKALSDAHGGFTFLDDKSIYTGTLTANQVNAVGISASSITTGTLAAERINAVDVVTRGLVAQTVHAATLQTIHNSGEPYIDIHQGIMDVYGTVARNIQFGVNDQGMAVLKYFDNDGRNIYDLGPNGLDTKNLQNAQWLEIQYVRVLSIMQTVPPEGLVSKENASVLFRLNTTWGLTTLYKYLAGKINNTIVSDSANGFTTAADAAAANDKLFTFRGAGYLANDTYTKNNAGSMSADTISEDVDKYYWIIQNGVSVIHFWKCDLDTFNMINGIY